MSGNLEGGKKAAETNKKRHGVEFYSRIGRKGGKLGRDGGFASKSIGNDGLTGRQRAIVVGKIGGKRSKRGKVKCE